MNIKKLIKNKKGFTLIEIIVVVVILAVLMAVAVPSVLKYMGEADDAKYMSQSRGQVIDIQATLADSYAKTANKTTWNASDVAKGVPAVTGVPAVDFENTKVYKTTPTVASTDDSWSGGTVLAAGDTPDLITSYEIAFTDGTKALVISNQQVVIDPR